jgi:sirohydrochlorin cobaltochelatase
LRAAVVLFARRSREPQWAQPVEARRAQLAARCAVEVAFLELMTPTLDEAVARLVARG